MLDKNLCPCIDCVLLRSEIEHHKKNNMAQFETGSTRSSDDNKLDYEGFLSPIVLERYAQYMHKFRTIENGTKRASDNWKLGISRQRYLKSLLRHMWDVWLLLSGFEYKAVEKNIQESLCAVMFNSMGLLHEILLERDVK